MNGYLLRKLRSEQQLMNELSKLLVSKDYATKKMSELLKELSFFYVSPSFARIPHSVLKDLIALLTHLKDKKEDLRIAKLVLCFLARILDQFELRYHQQALQAARGSRTQSFDMSLSMASGLLKVIETQELNHASLPRQVACLRLYGHLCRIFNSTDALILRTKPLIQKSPVWGLLTADKKVAASITGRKEYHAQLASLAAAFHGVRFHLSFDEQSAQFLENLLQAAFLPHSVASRHAAGTLLKLFELSNAHATQVTAQFESFFTKFRPHSLLVGDQLASIYLLRLCGQISRLPASDGSGSGNGNGNGNGSRANSSMGRGSFQQKNGSFAANLLDFSFDTVPSSKGGAGGGGGGATASDGSSPPPSPVARQRQRLEGVKVSSVLSIRLHDLFLDILCAPPSPSDASPLAKSVLLVAVEETVRDASADACIMKTRAGVSLFEVAAGGLLKLLRDASSPSATLSVVQLHRVVRAVQFTAEALDGSVLQMTSAGSGISGSSSASLDHQPAFLDRITDLVVELLAHSNPFVVCQSLRALVWLLPRPSATNAQADAKWEMLMARLLHLPVHQVQPESRQFIAESFFQRAVTNPSLHRHAVDVEMLRKCLEITLLWFTTQPCEWHAAMLVKIWTTALRKCLVPMGGDVFHSINAVLDFQHHALHATAEHVHYNTLDFLARLGAAYVVDQQQSGWFRALALRLTKQLLLGSLVARRLTVAVLQELHTQAHHRGQAEIVQHVSTLVQYLQSNQKEQQQNVEQRDVFVATRIHSQSAKDALGVQDLLSKCLEPRTANSVAIGAMPSISLSPFSGSNVVLASDFNGLF